MEFQKMFKYDFDIGTSEFYLNCFDTNFDKDLKNHQDDLFVEYDIVPDEDNDGFIYCYCINNCQGNNGYNNINIDTVVEILRKNGFTQKPDDAFMFEEPDYRVFKVVIKDGVPCVELPIIYDTETGDFEVDKSKLKTPEEDKQEKQEKVNNLIKLADEVEKRK